MDHFVSKTGIKVTLNDQELWKQFYPNTEMIVTKKKGRVIFPHLNYKIKGLEMNSLYQIFISLQRIDNLKLKFDQGKWHELGKGEPFLPIQYKEHPDGARPGSHWMKDIVSFSHLKITNDPENKDNKLICVQSMHKYIPVVTIKRVGDFEGEDFRLKLTEFVVVTAYQSEDMIKLKVSHNKFASGFRSSGKRSNSTEPENSPPKRRSTSSASNSSTPPTVSPPAWDQPLNVLTPVVFNQNTYQNPDMFPAQNPPFYWNPLYQGHAFDYNQMYMNPWNNGFPGM